MHVCLSGGADGADLAFGAAAAAAGHEVVHWSFRGHRTTAPSSSIRDLTQAELDEADPFLSRANLTLKRRWPPSSRFVANLLRRDWYQVRDAERCYAVSEIGRNGVVEGGTGWATHMFIDRHDGAECPCYVFCQHRLAWFEWRAAWSPIAAPPRPEGRYAGIGRRALTPSGAAAIASLYA